MSSEEPLDIMAGDTTFDQDKYIEFFYNTDMSCPVADCDFQGRFSTKTKYMRHWEERHLYSVQKMECAVLNCRTKVRRKSDMKSHLKFVHGERDERRIEEIVLKCSTVAEKSKNFIDPGFFCFKGRSKKSVDSSAPTTSDATSKSSSSVTPSASVVRSMLATSEKSDDQVQFNVHIPSSLSLSRAVSSLATSTSAAPIYTVSASKTSTTASTTRISVQQYKARPVKETPTLPYFPSLLSTQENSTQTIPSDLQEAYLPPIPETIPEIKDYIRTLCDHMDKVGRLREAAKEKLVFLQTEGPSLQKERELRRKLESENRELKRRLAEAKWRDNLFPPMEQ